MSLLKFIKFVHARLLIQLISLLCLIWKSLQFFQPKCWLISWVMQALQCKIVRSNYGRHNCQKLLVVSKAIISLKLPYPSELRRGQLLYRTVPYPNYNRILLWCRPLPAVKPVLFIGFHLTTHKLRTTWIQLSACVTLLRITSFFLNHCVRHNPVRN